MEEPLPETLAESITVDTASSGIIVVRLPDPEFHLKGILVAHTTATQPPVLAIVSLRVPLVGQEEGTTTVTMGEAWIRASSISAADGGHFFPIDADTRPILSAEVTIQNDTGSTVTVAAAAVVE